MKRVFSCLFGKKDIWVIMALLVVSVAAYFLLPSGGSPAGYVRIYVGGELYQTVELGEEQVIRIERDGKVNEVEVNASGVRMLNSTCENQTCVEQQWLTVENAQYSNWIICLPNQVAVELVVEP